jgi:hypothetical protein
MKDDDGQLPIRLACSCNNGPVPVVQLLLDNDSDKKTIHFSVSLSSNN